MSEFVNEAEEISALCECMSRPANPKPRKSLTSHLERSIHNFTVPHRNITVRETMKGCYSRNPKGNLFRKSLELSSSSNELAEKSELAQNSDEETLYLSAYNESPVFKNKSPCNEDYEGTKISTPQASSTKMNFEGYESRRYSKFTRREKYTESLERTPSPINGTKQGRSKLADFTKKRSTRDSIKKRQPTSDSSTFPFWKVLVPCTVVLIALIWIFYSNSGVSRNIVAKETFQDSVTLIRKLQKSIEYLKTEFHQQDDDIWYEITSAVRDVILNPVKPSMIILFANESNTMNCLARSVAIVYSQALNSDSYITLTRDNMGSNLGRIIHTLKPKIEEKPVVVVQDLLNIHPEAIKAFHNLCDRENPLVEKAVYIITMVISGYDKSENPLRFIENQITRKLSTLIDRDILMPLTIRLTEGPAIEVQAQRDLTNCLSI